MNITKTNWRWPLVTLIGSTVLLVISIAAIAASMLCVHIVLVRNNFSIDHVFYYVAMVFSFFGNVYLLFPFFLFEKDTRTEEERSKYYRIM